MMLELMLSAAARSLVVGAAAWLTLRLVRVRNPNVEALVWRMLLLAGLVLPALLYWNLAPRFTTSFTLPEVVVGAGGADPPAAAASLSWLSPARWLSSIYLGVSLLLLARLAAGLVGMGRVCREAAPLELRGDIRLSARVRSPATFGSIILLPPEAREWPAEKLAAVLAHERAHVRSRDGWWSWLAHLHAAIFWFNPLAWGLQRRLDMLAETTSDDAVVAARHDPLGYAALLLEFARHANSRRVVMSVAESNVPERIERLLAQTPPAAALPRVARWGAFAALIPVAILAASSTHAAAPAQPAAKAPAPALTASDSPPEVSAKLRSFPSPDDYYPAVAKALKVSGSVVVRASVDSLGQLVDVVVLEAQPADPQYGFADAALRIARASQYSSPSGKPSSIAFKVKFELAKELPKQPNG